MPILHARFPSLLYFATHIGALLLELPRSSLISLLLLTWLLKHPAKPLFPKPDKSTWSALARSCAQRLLLCVSLLLLSHNSSSWRTMPSVKCSAASRSCQVSSSRTLVLDHIHVTVPAMSHLSPQAQTQIQKRKSYGGSTSSSPLTSNAILSRCSPIGICLWVVLHGLIPCVVHQFICTRGWNSTQPELFIQYKDSDLMKLAYDFHL